MERGVIKGISLLKNSDYRKKILGVLAEIKYMTPSEIAKATDIRLNHISNFLNDLKTHGLISCLNEDEKRGRLYQITGLGNKVVIESEKHQSS